MSLQTTHNSITTSLQRELDKLRQEYQQLKVQMRELEMGNDDLERTEREVSSSLADVEAKYSRALEEKIILEHELLDKANLEEQCQRLRDDLRGLAVFVPRTSIKRLSRCQCRGHHSQRATSNKSNLYF
jgi:chromosome segregation ATPase